MVPGTTWTMASLFSQETGVPLKISNLYSNSMDLKDIFFPTLRSIGDFLKDEGYNNVAIMGSDSIFAATDMYYDNHGSFDLLDYHYFSDEGLIPKGYKFGWGVEDFRVFELARTMLTQLSQSGKPFNLNISTMDTHFEDGFICSRCPDYYDEQYANVIRCSSKQVAEFINWCKKQSFYQNTTIVITGDHLTMDRDFCDYMSTDYKRKTYVTILNSAVQISSHTMRKFTNFDLMPTILASIGYRINGEQIGLGVNLFSNKTTLIEQYGIEGLSAELSKRSRFIEELSGIREVTYMKDHYKNVDDFLDHYSVLKDEHDLVVLVEKTVNYEFDESSKNRIVSLGVDKNSDFFKKGYVGSIITHGDDLYLKSSDKNLAYIQQIAGKEFAVYNFAKIFDKEKQIEPDYVLICLGRASTHFQEKGIMFYIYDLTVNQLIASITFSQK